MRLITSGKLTVPEYSELAEELRLYDVVQGGWEHERLGIEFNAKHVLSEIVRARRKNPFDQTTVKEELAPDAAQFALRFARWVDLPIGSILPTTRESELAISHSQTNRYYSDRIGGWALAEIALADFTHRLDHPSEREDALKGLRNALSQTSRYLMYFAEVSAVECNFDLQESFMSRVDVLRERNIPPTPPTAT